MELILQEHSVFSRRDKHYLNVSVTFTGESSQGNKHAQQNDNVIGKNSLFICNPVSLTGITKLLKIIMMTSFRITGFVG